MKSLTQFIKESKINEGVGAGYNIELEGVKCNDFKLIGSNEKMGKEYIRKFSAELQKTVLDKWSTENYYYGVNSEYGVEYNGDIMKEYYDEDKTIEGGSITGYVYLGDIVYVDGIENNEELLETSDKDILDYLKQYLSDFNFNTMIGGGFSHSKLNNPMTFTNFKLDGDYADIEIEKMVIKAPKMVEEINWFYDNVSDFDEIFGGSQG